MVDVQRVLGPVPEERLSFWFNNGTIVRSLEELGKTLETLDHGVFKYHVNSEKNDLYSWILEIFGDEELAESLKVEHSQKRFCSKIKARLKELRKLKKSQKQTSLV